MQAKFLRTPKPDTLTDPKDPEGSKIGLNDIMIVGVCFWLGDMGYNRSKPQINRVIAKQVSLYLWFVWLGNLVGSIRVTEMIRRIFHLLI